MSKELYELFKPIVFKWLTVISDGTNKKVVKQLVSPKGINHTFRLPNNLCNKLFNEWQKKK